VERLDKEKNKQMEYLHFSGKSSYYDKKKVNHVFSPYFRVKIST